LNITEVSFYILLPIYFLAFLTKWSSFSSRIS
jgi:hypothetical protein